MDAPSSSLASDIVELVVLTADAVFLQTLREAVGPSRRLWHVASPHKVSDLLLAGGVGILVLDVQALLQQPASPFIAQIKQQFPDLVIVVAGARDAEAELARLVSDGTIYRFIHKPMSPARAQLFADAAVKRYDEQRKRTAHASGAASKRARHPMVRMALASALICAVGGALWGLGRAGRMSSAPADVPTGTPAAAAAAAAAQEARHLAAPSPDPLVGLASAREQLLARATNALLEERLDQAASAIEAAHRAGADGGRLALLSAELAKARAQTKAAAHAKSGGAMTPESAITQDAVLAKSSATTPAREPVKASAQAAGETRPAAEHRDDEDVPAKPSPPAAPPPPAAPEEVRPAGSSQQQPAPPNREPSAASVVHSSRLSLVKSVQPEYPKEARLASLAGWVELDFTVAASGQVKDISVHAANPRGVFDHAAVSALAQWRYQPLSGDSATASRRARIRIRFALTR
jgi:TonB family protein